MKDIGLYRDNGFIIPRNIAEKKPFKCMKFYIKVKYRRYRKPNENLVYINASSPYPPAIIKHIPQSLNNSLSENSSNETMKGSPKRL